MKAALVYGPRDVRVQDVPEPFPGPREIKVRVAYCGICGSDLEIFHGTFGLMKTPLWPKPPFTFGHEVSGVICELGSDLLGKYEVGQSVAMNFRSSCGRCLYCRDGKEHMCEHVFSHEAGFAQYAVYRESAVYPLPPGVSLEEGALLEPVTIAVHAVEQGGVRPGSTVAICGAGTIGLLILQIARLAGAARVLVSNPSAHKRALAEELGADRTVDPRAQDLVAIGSDFTGGRGFDVVFEASGRAEAAEQCLELAGRCGTVVWVGAYPDEARVPVNPFELFLKELTIRGSLLAPYVYPRALALLPLLKLRPLISEVVSLDDLPRVLARREGSGAVKTLVAPW
ncbi:MAG: zinc-binding dehydrogenase [Thermoleophilia bacterium]|nr:zinc-binding dehydrogenase [Thermoleophilia bacterium]